MRRPVVILLTALSLACVHRPPAPAAQPPEPAGARLVMEVPGHGRLLLEIPPGWTATPGEPDPPLPATLRLEPPGERLVLLVTPIWDPGAQPEDPASAETARTLVELARQQAAESAAEPSLPLLELGGGVAGWYFAATDLELVGGGRSPEPDEYRCLVQGAAVVGGVILSFSVLDDGPGPARALAFEVIRRARHEPP